MARIIELKKEELILKDSEIEGFLERDADKKCPPI